MVLFISSMSVRRILLCRGCVFLGRVMCSSGVSRLLMLGSVFGRCSRLGF